jgi:hypothetical protein
MFDYLIMRFMIALVCLAVWGIVVAIMAVM